MALRNTNLRKPDILVSIVTWNHGKTICTTIDSVLAQTDINCRIVVFDNKSSDETIDLLARYESRDNFFLIKNDENIGFCGGHNYVIKNFDFDFIALVNPDLILTSEYLVKAVRVFETDTQIGAVCGLLLQSFDQDALIDSAGLTIKRSRQFILRYHGLKVTDANLQSEYVSGLDGALPVFKKASVQSLLIKGDFFNPMFFAHKEDWDISWRLLLFGWKIYFEEKCVAIHPRVFKPNKIRLRLKLERKIKFDAFKNQFLLLMINEDVGNFLNDFLKIVPRMLSATIFCFFLEIKSLGAFFFILRNYKKIRSMRRQVQERRVINATGIRAYIQQ